MDEQEQAIAIRNLGRYGIVIPSANDFVHGVTMVSSRCNWWIWPDHGGLVHIDLQWPAPENRKELQTPDASRESNKAPARTMVSTIPARIPIPRTIKDWCAAAMGWRQA